MGKRFWLSVARLSSLPAVEKVTGIGGVFFKAKDVGELSDWYRRNLGIESTDGAAEFRWREQGQPEKSGRTVWSVFDSDSEYFGPAPQQWMINYRVANLPTMLAQLKANGVGIEKTEEFDYGSFAWIKDPEGNRIELWQPKGE
jgi:predicted enzyme related to lactoylglutathione lyase